MKVNEGYIMNERTKVSADHTEVFKKVGDKVYAKSCMVSAVADLIENHGYFATEEQAKKAKPAPKNESK